MRAKFGVLHEGLAGKCALEDEGDYEASRTD